MKTLALLFLLISTPASATYFRIIGQNRYVRQVLSEACFNPKADIGDAKSCTSVPIVTHSFRDGYVLIPNEDWTLVTVGGSFSQHSKPLFTIGPAANVAPSLKYFLLNGINAVTPENSFLNLKSYLTPAPLSAGPDVTINMGIKLGVYPTQRIIKDSLLILSIGPALSF